MNKFALLKTKMPIIKAATALFFAIVFAVFACCTAFGWFSNNKNVSSNGINLNVNSESISQPEIICYSYDSESATYKKSTDVTVENTKAALSTYDTLSSDKSYCVLLKMIFSGSFSTISLAAKSTAECYLGEYDGANLKKSLKDTNNSVSSIIQFYSLSTDEVEDFGSYCTIGDLSNNTPTSFVEISGSQSTFNTSVDIITNQQRTDGESTLTLYILLDYNENAMADIFGKNLGNSAIRSVSKVQFNDCDFYFEAY